uniref:Uncharacterized protein n=1 Tax=Candidatus Kentrum sp. TC TaxID=2126339 RepID=A0A450Z8D4_9GAMM|nr:MAG: hypothetical protein BECKTC1821E_GA0114239_103717 [Candidatus Kentron sp. TC]VFK50071.1 MAG: hypothetical protein BECKTC1821D_GA0114238_10896 [Candidatus Kentron sp. TC]
MIAENPHHEFLETEPTRSAIRHNPELRGWVLQTGEPGPLRTVSMPIGVSTGFLMN